MKQLLIGLILIVAIGLFNLASAQIILHDTGLTVQFDYLLAQSNLTAPLLYLDGSGNTPSSQNQSQAMNINLLIAPTFGFKAHDQLWISPGLDLTYSAPSTSLTVEEPIFIYTQQVKFEYWLGAILEFWPETAIGFRGFGLTEKLPYYKNETLDHAYYSFQDLGGTIKLVSAYQFGVDMESRLSATRYQRVYPDYYNLYADVEGDWRLQANHETNPPQKNNPNAPPQVDEIVILDPVSDTIDIIESSFESDALDYKVTTFRWGQLLGDPTELLSIDILMAWKILQYQHVAQIQSDGSLNQDRLRQDIYRDLTLLLYITLHKNHQVKLGYQYRNRSSNQNYFVYDVTTSSDVFIPSYYDYHYHALTIQYLFELPFMLADYSPKGKLMISLSQRQYQNRPSRQLTNAEPKIGQILFDHPLKEDSWLFLAQVRQQIYFNWLSLTLGYQYQQNTANTRVEYNPNYSFNYNFHLLTLGTEIHF